MGRGKVRRISDSTSSKFDSHSYLVTPSRLNANSHPTTSNNSNTQSQQSQSHSDSSTYRSPPKTLTSEVNAMSLTTPGELPSKRTQVYRHMAIDPGGKGKGKGKGKEKRRISVSSSSSSVSTSSSSDSSSLHSYLVTPSRLNVNSHPTTSKNSNTQSQQSKSHSDSSTFRSPPKTLTSEVNTMSLPTPGELPLKGTQGYNSLVLPRAPLPNSSNIRSVSTSGSVSRKWFGGVDREGKIDSTRSVVAQTTMASVEVISSGLGRQQGQRLGGMLMGMLRGRSTSGGRTAGQPRPIEGLDKPVDDATENLPAKVPQTSAGVEGTILGFTSYRKPPGYVPSGSVLVQVWAVGVDGVDGRLVGVNPQAQPPPQHHTLTKSSSQKEAQHHKMLQKATHRADIGYIPGRSFVGRVLECGWDDRDEEVKKGEWVVGLLDIKKVSVFGGRWLFLCGGREGGE